MKRILQVTKCYYPYYGGTEQVTRDIANVLREEGYEQKIICFNEDARDGQRFYHRSETIHDYVDGVEVVRCGCFTRVSSQLLSLTYGREMKKLMDDFKPNVVIFHYPNPFAAHYLMKYKVRDFKLVLYWHLDITKQKILKHIFKKQNLTLIERMKYVLGATPMHIETSEFTPYFGDKKRLLPYMINTDALVLSREEEQVACQFRQQNSGKAIGFFVGRHIPYKGLKYLIEASKELTNIPMKLLIAGDGELTKELKEQAVGDDKIVFLGRITDSERRIYYQACDFICFPSITRNEGFGLALAEGMYFGKPAVTFHIEGSGVNFVNLKDVTGLEVPNCDSHAYAEALKTLVEQPELRERMGKAAKQRVEEYFTPQQFKKNIIKLIEEK